MYGSLRWKRFLPISSLPFSYFQFLQWSQRQGISLVSIPVNWCAPPWWIVHISDQREVFLYVYTEHILDNLQPASTSQLKLHEAKKAITDILKILTHTGRNRLRTRTMSRLTVDKIKVSCGWELLYNETIFPFVQGVSLREKRKIIICIIFGNIGRNMSANELQCMKLIQETSLLGRSQNIYCYGW